MRLFLAIAAIAILWEEEPVRYSRAEQEGREAVWISVGGMERRRLCNFVCIISWTVHHFGSTYRGNELDIYVYALQIAR